MKRMPDTHPQDAAVPFRYAEYAPAPAIAPWVVSLWSFQADVSLGPDESYVVWPDGCTSVALLRLPGAAPSLLCVGPRLTAMSPPVLAGERIWGVRLWPDVLHAVAGVSPRTLREHGGHAPPPIEARFGSLRTALPASDDPDVVFPAMNGALLPLIAGARPPSEQVRRAVRAIVDGRGESPMAEVARAADTGLRHLQRLFPEATGLTLREYARIRRLREALARRIAARPPGWSRIAADTGFVDHAHLTREFRTLTGLLPTHASQQLARTAHENVVP
jgi:AraC-like DNA-binding protein